MEETKNKESVSEEKKDPAFKWYDLKDCLYSHKYSFPDIYQPLNRYARYEAYSHSGLYDARNNLPKFVSFLKTHGYTSVWKVFKSYNLEDDITEIDPNYSGSVMLQFLRTIDLFFESISRESILASFRQAREERLEISGYLKGLKLKFSADPWEIATMSMRGITSCMSWGSTHSMSLAGSILDPYCGVISLVGDTVYQGSAITYGNVMAARSVVRLVRDDDKIKLLLEKPYFGNKNIPFNKSSLISKIFKDYLCSKTGLSVLVPDQLGANTVIPFFPDLQSLPENVRSYRDSRIKYAEKNEK